MTMRSLSAGLMIAVFGLLFITLFAAPASAQMLLNENFEQDPDDWPWATGEDNGWQCVPWPPTAPDYTWAVEESTVYHYGHEGWYRSLFCSGLPNDLNPGVDDYPPDQEAWAIWGPFSSTDDMVTVLGNFYVWADTEPWDEGEGDNFYMLAAVDPDQAVMEEWDIAFDMGTEEGFLQSAWTSIEFDLTDMWDWDGNPVSLLPEGGGAVDNIYIAFVFISDEDDNTGHGVFIDDIYVGGYDGEFDYEMEAGNYFSLEDTTYHPIHHISAGDEIYVKATFRAFGYENQTEASHVLYINDDVLDPESEYVAVDTLTDVWEANPFTGKQHQEVFELPITFADTGYAGVKVLLDATEAQEESDESNNVWVDTVYILPPQTPPEMIWHDLIGTDEEEGVVYVDISETSVLTIDYTALNSPVTENATISFAYGTEQDSNGIFIPSLSALPIDNERHQAEWDISLLEEDQAYYLFAYLADLYYPGVFSYADQQVMKILPVGEREKAGLPKKFEIASAYPNPFNPTVELAFAMPQAGEIELNWYSLDGRLVQLQVRTVSSGYPVVSWTPMGLASGMYVVKAVSPFGSASTRVLYLK